MLYRASSLFLVSILLAVVYFLTAGCGDVSDKLDTHLNSLVDAERRGEAESFAQLALIDLVDGDVIVGVESKPGQLEAVIKAVAKYGTVEYVSERQEKVQAIVPIASLTALAREDSIRFIRVPDKPSHGLGQ